MKSEGGADDGAGAGLATLFGSAFAITGTLLARMVWNGGATKWPAESNHSLKGLASSMVLGLPPLGVMVILT